MDTPTPTAVMSGAGRLRTVTLEAPHRSPPCDPGHVACSSSYEPSPSTFVKRSRGLYARVTA